MNITWVSSDLERGSKGVICNEVKPFGEKLGTKRQQ